MSRDSWVRRMRQRHAVVAVDRRSPAERLGYEPCPTCGGRREKSAISRARNGAHCGDGFHRECGEER